MHGLARGQTEGYNCYYWFDGQQGKVHISPKVQGLFDVDASMLSDGIHTFHCLAVMDNGGISMPIHTYFLKGTAPSGQIKCLCSVDSELVYHEFVPAEGGIIHWNLNLSNIAEGLHKLQIDALKVDGVMSDSQHCYFVKLSKADTAVKGYYWFDEETNVHEASVTNGKFDVDASSLSDGFHRFYYMALQENGSISIPSTCYFLKTANVNPDDELTCICTVDGQLRHIEKLSQQGSILHWNLDMQDLADGVHQISLQAVTSSGAVSNSYNSYFMRVTSTEDLNEMYCVYAIDGNALNSKSNVVSNAGSFHFDLDLSELEEGLHYISFMLYSDRGTSTAPQLRFFLKTPLGGNGITKYQYWINDENISTAKTVTLQEKVNPLQLMSLIPIESRPLRSSLFHFDISSGKPMIYAKNTIHLRFYDVAQRFSDVAKDYNDYQVGHEVEPVGTLQSIQTFEKVAENDIRWYTLHAASGDTVAFKLSQAATIQLFAPSGEEVFKTSESASLKWGGIHIWEDGTYYLAVHDVTGRNESMNLEYMHMDKYDVVDWDVHTVGNGGCSTITFKGNGFRDLYAVDLYNAQGDNIRSVAVGFIDDANASVTFNFTDVPLGKYNAVFHFTTEDRDFQNILTVEEAKDIELALDVKYPSSFLCGTSTTYSITVTNKGKSTAYDVPMEIYLQNSSSFRDIESIMFKDELGNVFNNYTLDNLNKDSIHQETIDYLKSLIAEFKGLQSFIVVNDSLGSGEYGFTDQLVTIPPKSSSTFYVEIKSSSSVALDVKIPSDWIAIHSESKTTQTRREGNILDKDWCCEKEKWQCISGVISNLVGLFPVAGCIYGAVDYIFVNDIFEIACTDGPSIGNKIESFYLSIALDTEKHKSHTVRGVSTLIGCLGALKDLKEFKKAVNYIKKGIDIPSAISTCNQWNKNNKDCSPNILGGGTSTSVTSLDPNDIFGYLSETGSKFIADSVARVNYTIEFENDTTFATAAAHTIVIKDTLDNQYFDLAKFMPIGIRIGEHEIFLNEADVMTKNNVTSFVKTIDMRPEINAIAQVDGAFSHNTGIAEWRFTSLDPMTMESTDDLMQGILPVNYNGTSGIGEVMFEIGLKQGKVDGTELKNRASIVFDYEEAILTPTWTNIVDAVPPTSIIDDFEMENDTTLRINVNGFDARSGVWKYELYVQHGENAPWWKEGETDSTYFDFRFYEDIDYGFCVLATDSAGNVEKKVVQRERGFMVHEGDYEDTIVQMPETATETKDTYDISGRKVGRKAKGVIIRKGEGKSRKVMIK